MTKCIVVLALLCISSVINCFLLFKMRSQRRKTESIELKQFLADLLSGPAHIAVARMDADDFLMRSPKRR